MNDQQFLQTLVNDHPEALETLARLMVLAGERFIEKPQPTEDELKTLRNDLILLVRARMTVDDGGSRIIVNNGIRHWISWLIPDDQGYVEFTVAPGDIHYIHLSEVTDMPQDLMRLYQWIDDERIQEGLDPLKM